MDVDKNGLTLREDAVVVKSKKRVCVAHCKRFWWAYLIAVVAVVLLVVLLIIFVAIPKIAQKKMDQSELSIDSILISETEPLQYRMSVNSTIRTDGKTHAKIDGFTGVLYLEDKEGHVPFASIDFPETTSEKVSTVNVSQVVEIKNMDEFATFNTWLLLNETLKLTVEGDTKVHLKGLSKAYGVTFKKTVELAGINGFKGLEVTHSDVNTLSTTNNYHAFVDVPNASILTIEIGNATFATFLDGEDIGTIYMDDLVLYPGVRNVSIRGDIEQGPILIGMTTDPYCGDGVLPFELHGKNVTRDGEELVYFADAVRALTNAVDVPLTNAFARADLVLSCLNDDGSSSDGEDANIDDNQA